ncbi:type-1 fimbrial protein subunit A [Salmonella enterica subsp. enterica serovar Choleraesuis]|nr:type-1 fimbrial protein subunit A [Salmonella enterica subsp. enterica serovar Choleraesuis]
MAEEAPTVTTDGGVIHFTGRLVNAACSVSTESDGQTVKLGEYRTASMKGIGTESATRPFTIVLNDCDSSISSMAKVAFSGQTIASGGIDNSLLNIASSENKATASGVGIQILDEDSTPLILDGATFSKGHKLIDGTNTLNFSARYVSVADEPEAGEANADATFTMQYQ